jgi:hypothetical protein
MKRRKIKGTIIWTVTLGIINYLAVHLGKPIELYISIWVFWGIIMLTVWEEELLH